MKGKAAGGKAAVIRHYWLRENPKRASADCDGNFCLLQKAGVRRKFPPLRGKQNVPARCTRGDTDKHFTAESAG